MTVAERRITLAEAIALTLLLGCCIAAFVHRRMREQRLERGQAHGDRRARCASCANRRCAIR